MHGHATPGRGAGTGAVVSGAVLVVGLAVTVADVPMAWLVWPLGYGVVLPLAVAYASREQRDAAGTQPGTGSQSDDRLARVKEAYVTGEIDEAEFERRLEAAMEDDAAA
ncbi:MAG: SHOCT domain-containing protein [Haloarculaceae archaeon]